MKDNFQNHLSREEKELSSDEYINQRFGLKDGDEPEIFFADERIKVVRILNNNKDDKTFQRHLRNYSINYAKFLPSLEESDNCSQSLLRFDYNQTNLASFFSSKRDEEVTEDKVESGRTEINNNPLEPDPEGFATGLRTTSESSVGEPPIENKEKSKRSISRKALFSTPKRRKSNFGRNAPSMIKKRSVLDKNGDLDGDSSDEEEIKRQRDEYSLNLENINFNAISRKLNVPKDKVIKSFLLHNIGRMIIYSPKIDNLYYENKEKLLKDGKTLYDLEQKQSTPKTVRQKGKKYSVFTGHVRTEELGISITNIDELIAFGRLTRRSQIRYEKEIGGYYESRELKLDVEMTSGRSKRSSSIVEETLIAGYNGLGRENFPSTDHVNLGGKSQRGDYGSAYKDRKSDNGEVASTQFLNSTKELEKSKDENDDEKNQLKVTIALLTKLKLEISSHYPEINNDIFIAESIRKVCRSEPLNFEGDNSIKDKIYSLTYLLFKTEIYRSPAALLSNIQMLDLVINGEISLENLFNKNEMPMSPSGAIRAARELESLYNEDGFYQYRNPYRYSSNTPNKKGFTASKLAVKEADLFDKWLELKLGQEVVDNIEENLSEVLSTMHDSLAGFGLSFESLTILRNVIEKQKVQENQTSHSSSFSSSSSELTEENDSPNKTPRIASALQLQEPNNSLGIGD